MWSPPSSTWDTRAPPPWPSPTTPRPGSLGPQASSRTSSTPDEVAATAYAPFTVLYCVGRGHLFPVALEAALKLKEAARLPAEGWASAGLRHGPISLVNKTLPVLALVGQVRNPPITVPSGLPEPPVAIPVAVRAQQIAQACADRRGLDPDHPGPGKDHEVGRMRTQRQRHET